ANAEINCSHFYLNINQIKMIKVIRIPHNLTADLFGCEVAYFIEHIRGKRVTVVSETPHFQTIEDANGEQWTINKKDLVPKVDDEEVIEVPEINGYTKSELA